MVAAPSSWLVSGPLFTSSKAVSIDGTGYTFDAQQWYLRSATASESLVDQLQTHMTTEGLTGASVYVTRRRTVVISATPTFAITWTDTEIRDALGFSANLSAASSYEADYPSPYLFSAGFPVTRPVPDGWDGYPVEDERREISRDGAEVRAVAYNTQTWDELQWTDVVRARVFYDQSGSDQSKGGTWMRFRELVFKLNRRYKLHESIIEDESSATAVSWDTALGNYRAKKLPVGNPPRTVSNANIRWALGVECIKG